MLLKRLRIRDNRQKEWLNFPRDPVKFSENILRLKLWVKQAEICRSVENNRFTIVESGHGVGKSLIAAALVSWWMSTRRPALALTLAPTWSQVAGILWRHIRGHQEIYGLPGKVLQKPFWKISSDRFAQGLSPRKQTESEVRTIQGFHGPNLLVIMDEGSLLPSLFWDAATSLVTGSTDRLLVLGQPFDRSGPFWRASRSPRWNRIGISCFDHPNVVSGDEVIPGAVSRIWVDERIEDWSIPCTQDTPGAIEIPYRKGEFVLPSPAFFSHVLGQAPEESEEQLIHANWLALAKLNWLETMPPEDEEIILGLDPARFGSARSALCCRRGKKVLWLRFRQGCETTDLVRWLEDVQQEVTASRIAIDDIGVGAGVVDQAREKGLPAIGVNFSSRATDAERYINTRAECYWRLREALQKGELVIPPFEFLLEADLLAIRYELKKKVQIEEKKEVSRRLGRSPDAADSLALTFAFHVGESSEVADLPSSSRWTISEPVVGRWGQGRFTS